MVHINEVSHLRLEVIEKNSGKIYRVEHYDNFTSLNIAIQELKRKHYNPAQFEFKIREFNSDLKNTST